MTRYCSAAWRWISDTDLEAGLKQALSLDHSLAEIRFHGQEAFTVEGRVPASVPDGPA